MLVLDLDQASRAHLRRALEEHARWCRSNGHRVPATLADLALLVRTGQGRTDRDRPEDFPDDGPMTPLVYTFAECAEQLRVSERHVRRLVEAGLLRPVEVGERKRRIARQDLEEYIAGLRGAPAIERATELDSAPAQGHATTAALRAYRNGPGRHPTKETR